MALISKFRSWSSKLTPYFIYLLLSATLGPLLFGYHLVSTIHPTYRPQDPLSKLPTKPYIPRPAADNFE